MDTIKEVTIDVKKYKIYWIVMLILFFIFSIVVVKTIQKANKAEIAKIEEANKKAEVREAIAKIRGKEAEDAAVILGNKVSGLEKQLSDQNKILNKMELGYSKSMSELLNLKNEKDYIPTNVSTDEQFKFITNYKYTEY